MYWMRTNSTRFHFLMSIDYWRKCLWQRLKWRYKKRKLRWDNSCTKRLILIIWKRSQVKCFWILKKKWPALKASESTFYTRVQILTWVSYIRVSLLNSDRNCRHAVNRKRFGNYKSTLRKKLQRREFKGRNFLLLSIWRKGRRIKWGDRCLPG